MNKYVLIAIAISAICTFALRALPFLVTGYRKVQSEKIAFLGRILPPAIMAILLVYCLKDVPSDIHTIGIPKIAGVFTTGLSYVWKHNTFLSVILGTVVYMVFLRFI